MRNRGRVLFGIIALLLLITRAAWAADTFSIQVDGQDAQGKTYPLQHSAHLAIDVAGEGVYNGCQVSWRSSNESVAIVNLGMVYAQSQNGTAVITATAVASTGATTSRSLYVQVTGEQDKTTVSLRASGGVTTLEVGDTLQLIADVSPAGTALKWSSATATVASVDQEGLVTANKAGTAKVTAAAQDGSGAKGTITLTVRDSAGVSSLKLNKAKATLYVGGVTKNYKSTFKLTATVKPASLADSVAWSSSNEDVATVESGKVTAHKAGKATIRVKGDGKSAACVITVHKLPTKVNLPDSGRLKVGEKVNLAKQLKIDGTITRVKWKSANKKICKVSPKGIVLGIRPGKARVKATAVNGKSAVCVVQVVRR